MGKFYPLSVDNFVGQLYNKIGNSFVSEHCRTSDDCVPKEQISGRIGRPIERKDVQAIRL